MNSINKEINYSDGTSSIINISSNDNYRVALNNKYVLANKNYQTSKFKNSILGSDIGIKSSGFANITFLATMISIITFCLMIISFRV